MSLHDNLTGVAFRHGALRIEEGVSRRSKNQSSQWRSLHLRPISPNPEDEWTPRQVHVEDSLPR